MEVIKDISEKDVTRAIISGFAKDLDEYADMDVIIVGSGPAGMSVASVYATPRMGPIFGGMVLSGQKVAEIALKKLGKVTPAGTL